MIKGLRARLSFVFIVLVSAILLIAGLSVIIEAHYHFSMYQHQAAGASSDFPALGFHLEQALIRSIIWTCVGSILLTVFISLYAAKRISAPLVEMKHAAEQMARGQLSIRIKTNGNDELSDLGKSLNELTEQLQKQEQLRNIMTQDIAHELRTPLATLKSHMQAFEDGVWELTSQRIHACYEEIERLIHLVSDLEQLTYMESPHFQLHPQKEEIGVLIKQSVDLVSASYLAKRVHLSVKDHPPIKLIVDRQRFVQILVNLLTNALKFTPEGRHVEIQVADEEKSVLMTVKDTGTGIMPEHLPYVFERFYRADKSRNRKSGGGGIGLTIVKKLVEAHGGSVWIESNQGAKVYVRFPKGMESIGSNQS